MQPLPPDFLTEIARQHNLSAEQEEAFVERFRIKQKEQAVAEALHISTNALRSLMSGIYTKFSIGGKGPGKLRQLHDLLLQKYRQANPSNTPTSDSAGDIDALVQEVRQKVHGNIQARCGTMRVLDMTQPIELGDIYTSVNILEKIIGRRRLEMAELLQDYDLENFDRFGLGRIHQARVPGLEAVERHSKLMILGKPGAGKTTFLKRLATLCNLRKFQGHRVPTFVTLKNFAEAKGKPGLLTYITKQWLACGIRDITASDRLLNQGRLLVLLDGLDEVRKTDNDRVLEEIRDFTTQFHTCQFVITCRIAAREYTFEQFTEVEVADFNLEQIDEFARKWFHAQNDLIKAERFTQKLKDNEPIQELATNPLLLILLCLVFGEAADFPRNRSELYKEGLDVLLKKWDAKRNIERDQVYRHLSLMGKQDLLSQIAFKTFANSEYFFKQKTVEQQIADYIHNLPEASTAPETRQLDSEAVLRSIEAQHGLLVERARGIYSFSHLTFQEYFTARKVTSSTLDLNQVLQELASHITEKRWREVFLLAVETLRPADPLLQLMKAKIDTILAGDTKLQELLTWTHQKFLAVDVAYKPAAVRAWYSWLALALNQTVRTQYSKLSRRHASDILTATPHVDLRTV